MVVVSEDSERLLQYCSQINPQKRIAMQAQRAGWRATRGHHSSAASQWIEDKHETAHCSVVLAPAIHSSTVSRSGLFVFSGGVRGEIGFRSLKLFGIGQVQQVDIDVINNIFGF